MSLAQLDSIILCINSGFVVEHSLALNMKAAILNAFFLMLRISEYTTKTTTSFTMGKDASRSDIEFFPNLEHAEGYRQRIPKSKADQFYVGHVCTIYKTGHPTLCPVLAMQALFQNDKKPFATPLFSFGNSNSTRNAFVSSFDNILKACNIPTSHIKTHSLRSGGATAYLQTGTDPYIVAKMGRWASFCFTIYTWASSDHLRAAARGLAFGARSAKPINLEPLRLGTYDDPVQVQPM